MKNIILFTLLTTVSLLAQDASDEQLQSIYTEAILFVAIFGAMGIISFIYSSRHAKAYAPSDEELKRIQKGKEEKTIRESRIEKLSLMRDAKALTQEEFAILESHYTKE